MRTSMLRSGAGVLSLCALVACAPTSPPARGVVLVTLDTVRADHLGCYGYARNTSPSLDALAAEATRYTRAMASSPWTLPSHASLFTGLDPFEHGARTFRPGPERTVANPLEAQHLTLAEALREEGFRTAAFVANQGYLARRYRLDQGFEVYEVHAAPAVDQVGSALAWLAALVEQGDDPFFLFLNFMDAHRPYNTAPRPEALPPTPDRDGARLLERLYRQAMPGRAPAPPDLVRRVVLQYDAGISNADRGLERLFAGLRALGLYDEALVVVTSDHGEYFGEHALVEHSKDVYQPALWIPLVVKAPGQRRGGLVETPLVSADLPRLVASALGGGRAARVADRFPPRPEGPRLAENYYTRNRDFAHPVWGSRFDRVRRAVYDWPHKLIHSSDGRHELYDLAGDPAEQLDLHAARPEVAARLRAEVEARTRDAPETPAAAAGDLDDAEREALRELGYLEP